MGLVAEFQIECEALPRSRLVEFCGISHGGPGEAPEMVTAEVNAFLDNTA